jgi:hypothetical protein
MKEGLCEGQNDYMKGKKKEEKEGRERTEGRKEGRTIWVIKEGRKERKRGREE